MIKVISFDIGGTLLLLNDDKTYDIKELSKIILIDEKIIKDAYKETFQKHKGTFNELVIMFCMLLGIEKTKEIEEFFYHKFYKEDKSVINPEAINIIKYLKEHGYKIICVSNSNVFVKQSSLKEIEEYIDKIYYSYSLGYTKNEDELYDIIENDLGYKPEDFLHIGDTLSADYINPRKNGWNALYYGNGDKEVDSIDNLEDIKMRIK